jgi:hypothetical protein
MVANALLMEILIYMLEEILLNIFKQESGQKIKLLKNQIKNHPILPTTPPKNQNLK